MSHSSTASSVGEEGFAYVQFRSPDGTFIRFTEGEGCLIESVYKNGGWAEVGVAERLFYDAAIRHLADQNQAGGILPAQDAEEILERLVKIADAANVPHNIRFGTEHSEHSVVFKAPSGDVVRFVATQHEGIEEYVRNSSGGWSLVGLATHFDYDPTTRSLLDQNGCGGVLPTEDLQVLLQNIKKLASRANITHTIHLEPFHKRYPRRRGLEANASLLLPPKIPQKYTYDKRERKQRQRSSLQACKALLVTASGGHLHSQRFTDRIRNFLGRKYPNTVCQELSTTTPSRDDLLRGLEWLVAGTSPGDVLFISVIGMADPYTGLAVMGGFTQQDWRAYLSTVPRGVNVTILSETFPAVDLVSLPYKVSVNAYDEGFVLTEDERAYSTEARVTMVCTQAAEATDEGQMVLADSVIECLDSNLEPTYKELLGCVKRAMQERGGSNMAASVSSNVSFDPVKEVFTMCHSQDAPPVSLLAEDLPAYARSNSSDSMPPSVHSSELDDAIHGTPLNTSNEVRKALFFIYRRVNPTKLHLVDRFVNDYKGQYRSLFELISRKYSDPSILDAYSPFWGP